MGTRVRLLAVHQRQEILALHRPWRLHTEEAEDRRRDVVGGGVVVALLARPLAFGVAHEKDYIRKLRIQRGGNLTGVAMLAVGDPVVGEEYQEGVLEEA